MPLDGVAFSRPYRPYWGRIFNRVTKMGSHIIGFFEVGQFFIFTVSKRNRVFVPQTKSKKRIDVCKSNYGVFVASNQPDWSSLCNLPSSVANNEIEALTPKRNVTCFILLMYLTRTKLKQSLHTRLFQKTKS